jgi:hypothetical protein
MFEVSAAVSGKLRRGVKILREFYIMGDNEILYPIDQNLLYASNEIVASSGFDKLFGADLIFACIAKVEAASLITLDDHFNQVADKISVVNLNESRVEARYRRHFPMRKVDL